MRAIVLLGYRNSGKDSVCKELEKRLTLVKNAKFGEFNKQLTADLLEVPRIWLEDKEWREEEYIHGVTPLEVLNAFFVYSQQSPKFQQKIDSWCLSDCDRYEWVVFTDVRRVRELNKVIQRFGAKNTRIFFLERYGLTPSEGDEEVDQLVEDYSIEAVCINSIEENADKILKCLRVELKKQKPNLHLVTKERIRYFEHLPTYEPLQDLADSISAFIEFNKVDPSCFPELFTTAYNNLDLQSTVVSEVKEDSYMVYVSSQHAFLLPKLREKANLRVHVPQDALVFPYTVDFYSQEFV